MRVEDHSHVQLQASRHNGVEGHGKKDGLEHVKGRHDHGHHHEGRALGHHKRTDPVAISDEARSRFESMKKRSSETREREFTVPGGLDPKGLLNRIILGAFKGQNINVTGLLGPDKAQGTPFVRTAPGGAPQDTEAAAGIGTSSFSAEVEQLSFSASGTIRTKDGEEVGFTLELNVTRASMSGYAAGAAADGQNGVTVNFGGTSAELYSMSFEFNIANDEESVQAGIGSFNVDKPESGSVDHDERSSDDDGEGSLASSVPDFLKLLRRAEFTSTYLSFSRTMLEASSFMQDVPEIDPALAARPMADAAQQLDVLA